MAIYREPFGIILQTDYQINEDEPQDSVDDPISVKRPPSNQLPLFTDLGEARDSHPKILHSGGRFDWSLAPLDRQTPIVKPEIKVQLMRLWTVQMVQQLVSNKSYVNEVDSKIKIKISKEDLETSLRVMDAVTSSIHKEMDDINNRMVTKKKIPSFSLT